MECYSVETLTFENPILRNVTTSVLITMVGSKRRAQYMAELARQRPTEKVVVLHNQGRKRCRKHGVRNSLQDLWHANQQAFAMVPPGEAVLILEDDVRFLPEFAAYAIEIEHFLLQQKGPCAYNLGAHVLVSVPTSAPHIRVVLGGMAQAMLYNSKALDRLSRIRIDCVPHDLVVSTAIKTYTFFKALTFQRLCKTDNSYAWNVGGVPLIVQKEVLGFGSSRKSFEHSHRMAAIGGIYPPVLSLLVLMLAVYKNTRSL